MVAAMFLRDHLTWFKRRKEKKEIRNWKYYQTYLGNRKNQDELFLISEFGISLFREKLLSDETIF